MHISGLFGLLISSMLLSGIRLRVTDEPIQSHSSDDYYMETTLNSSGYDTVTVNTTEAAMSACNCAEGITAQALGCPNPVPCVQ